MTIFRFVGIDADGQQVRGSVEGFSEAAVTADLLDTGLGELRVRRRRRLNEIEVTHKKVKPVALMHFSRHLATFVRAGVPLLEALNTLSAEVSDKALRHVVLGIADALRRGETLTEATANYADVLPPFYVGVLRSAEVTGRLDDVLEQLSGYLERDVEAKRKIRSALAYPMVILVMAVVTVVVLAGFVLPRFKTFFTSFGAKLPLATRMLLAVTDFVTAWGLVLAAGLVATIVLVAIVAKTRPGKMARDHVLLRIPVLKHVVQYAVTERFCRLLGSMVQVGVPLPDAMTIAGEGVHNLVYEKHLAAVREAMMRGEGLVGPITRTGLFPPSATLMMRVGEDTGTLDTQLEVTARFFEQELGYKIKNLTTLFEPAVIVVMGFIVGFVAIAMVSAIYGIYNQVQL
ncbi:MAG: type II secretion system F family protein [Actinomycetota bacterium]|nr:type II secretion system F family protein [Actinomycetota bacterium]